MNKKIPKIYIFTYDNKKNKLNFIKNYYSS